MVFFTSILIVAILYYLQADGLIYVTIIAVLAELINIFMTHTLTKSVEKKAAGKFEKISNGYKLTIASQKKTIKEFEHLQEDSINKIYKANLKIKEYEEKFGLIEDSPSHTAVQTKEPAPAQKKDIPKDESKKFIDLPSGSNRKKTPF